MRGAVKGAAAYDLTQHVDRIRGLEHPSRAGRDLRVQVNHSGFAAPEESEVVDIIRIRGSTHYNAAERIDPIGYTERAAESAQILQAGFRGDHGMRFPQSGGGKSRRLPQGADGVCHSLSAAEVAEIMNALAVPHC